MKTAKPLFTKISAIGFSIMMLLPFQIALLVLMIKRAGDFPFVLSYTML